VTVLAASAAVVMVVPGAIVRPEMTFLRGFRVVGSVMTASSIWGSVI